MILGGMETSGMAADARRSRREWPDTARRWLTCAALAGIALLPAMGASAQPEMPVVRLQLQWSHQAQFAGFYVAEALGFYEREGIAVDFIPGGAPFPGGPVTDPLQVLALGGADVAVAWMSNALAARGTDADVINIAQIFRQPGAALLCRRDAGIRRPADIKGKRIGVWNIGDEQDVGFWLRRQGLTTADVTLVPQRPDGADLIERTVDCATAMTYNEYWMLLQKGVSPADLFIVRFADEQAGLLEDGLYATGAALANADMRGRLVRFLRATAAGWRYAKDNPEEALAVTLHRTPGADVAHQRRMLETVLALADPHRNFGLLDLNAYNRSIRIASRGASAVTDAARYGWTHAVWREAGINPVQRPLTEAVRLYLSRAVDTPWFYGLDLAGTVAFGLAGFMRALQRRYDLWGAFMLTMLPAVAGGTLRDLLIGGDRHPPFIFKDPTYIVLVFVIVLFGAGFARFLSERAPESPLFNRTLTFFDAIGLATFTVIGAKVALMADLVWYWVPFCAALTCAGGGMLLDIVTGREPRTFQGEPYEEIAVCGGLLLFVLLLIANRYEYAEWLATAAILTTIAAVFAARVAVVRYGIRSYRLGGAGPLPERRSA